ncbi:MAG: hypothetical protein IKT40_09150 [Bacilli bacterium]|nr:hypothetical protein [Bacilli bacterium]
MNGYEKEYQEAISIINKRGFIKIKQSMNYNPILYKYNFNINTFVKSDTHELMKLFNKVYLNSYDVNYGIEEIISGLKVIDKYQLENYFKYAETIKNNIPGIEDIQVKINDHVNENESLKKPLKIPNVWQYPSILQALINSDIFTDGKGFYKYNDNWFTQIPTKRILDYIKPEYLEETIYHETLSYNNIIQNGNVLKDLININDLAIQLDKYNNAQKIISDCENDYNYVMSIINEFS